MRNMLDVYSGGSNHIPSCPLLSTVQLLTIQLLHLLNE